MGTEVSSGTRGRLLFSCHVLTRECIKLIDMKSTLGESFAL